MDDFVDSLKALVGEQAGGLSASTIFCLQEQWSTVYEQWCRRALGDKQYV